MFAVTKAELDYIFPQYQIEFQNHLEVLASARQVLLLSRRPHQQPPPPAEPQDTVASSRPATVTTADGAFLIQVDTTGLPVTEPSQRRRYTGISCTIT